MRCSITRCRRYYKFLPELYPRRHLGKGCSPAPRCIPQGKEGLAPSHARLIRTALPPCNRRSLALRQACRVDENAGCHVSRRAIRPRFDIMRLALRTAHSDSPQGRLSLGLLPCPRQVRLTSRAAGGGFRHAPLWPMQCAPWRELSYPQTPPEQRDKLDLPTCLPIIWTDEGLFKINELVNCPVTWECWNLRLGIDEYHKCDFFKPPQSAFLF